MYTHTFKGRASNPALYSHTYHFKAVNNFSKLFLWQFLQ